VHRPVLERGEDQGADLAPPDEGAAASAAEQVGKIELLVADALAKVPAQLLSDLVAEVKAILAVAMSLAVTNSSVFEHLS
jgi:hypothetical protein